MTKTATILWRIAGVLFIVMAGVVVYQGLPILNPAVESMAALNPDCDLRAGSCESLLPGGGRVSFAIQTPGIPLMKPLDLEVRLDGVTASKVEVDFVGLGMNMGFNRSRLEDKGGRVFTGTGMLSVCVRAAMEWEARVLITTRRGLIVAPFQFIAVKDGALSSAILQ